MLHDLNRAVTPKTETLSHKDRGVQSMVELVLTKMLVQSLSCLKVSLGKTLDPQFFWYQSPSPLLLHRSVLTFYRNGLIIGFVKKTEDFIEAAHAQSRCS